MPVAFNILINTHIFKFTIVCVGNCKDKTTLWSPPPNGLQLLLTGIYMKIIFFWNLNLMTLLANHDKNKSIDTLVMQNLGYFQFRANPGIWTLSLAKGSSTEVLEIISGKSVSIPLSCL